MNNNNPFDNRVKKGTNRSEELFQKLTKNMGCTGLAALVVFVLAGVTFIMPALRLFFCGLLGVRCIDDETGEYITIPWIAIGEVVALGIILILIDKGIHWYKTPKKPL